MRGKTHVALGLATALTMSNDQPFKNKIIILAASMLGSLAPDLDHPKALLNQKLLKFNNNFYRMVFYLSFSLFFIYMYMDKMATVYLILGIICLLVGVSVHRSFTHSLFGFLAFISVVKIIALEINLNQIYIGFSIGYLMHLIADFFTPKGIQLFYPLKGKTVSPITIKTSGKFEDILFSLASIYSIIMLFKFIKL